jgi:RHS repeat-associated protein
MISEAQMYHYKARAYDPALGRFLQTDPAGYEAGDMNLYAYVGNNPLNEIDPSGKVNLPPATKPGITYQDPSGNQWVSNANGGWDNENGFGTDGETPPVPPIAFIASFYMFGVGPNLGGGGGGGTSPPPPQKSPLCPISNALEAWSQQDLNTALASSLGGAGLKGSGAAGGAAGGLAVSIGKALTGWTEVFSVTATVEAVGAGLINGSINGDFTSPVVDLGEEALSHFAGVTKGVASTVDAEIGNQINKAAKFSNPCSAN